MLWPVQTWTQLKQQQWTIIRRNFVKMRRNLLISLTRVLFYPLLMLGGFSHMIEHSGQSNDSEHCVAQVPYIMAVTLFITVPNVYAATSALVMDKTTKMKTLMISMGLTRVNYYCAMSITFMLCTLPVTWMIALISKIYILDDTVSYLTILSLLTLFTLQLDAVVAANALYLSSTSMVIIVFGLMAGADDIMDLIQWLIDLIGQSLSPVVIFFASSSPYMSIILFASNYVKEHNRTNENNDELPVQPACVILATQVFWIVILRSFSYWFEEVCPWHRFAPPRDFLFCLKRASFFKKHQADKKYALDPVPIQGCKYFEPCLNRSAADIGIEMKNIRKTFGGDEQVAVNGVTFNVYRGETTLLLGHNGAGKSTLMNIILGLLEPDDGYVKFSNSNGSDTPSSVGVCPQVSILDDDLTVKEHLELFSDIKSLNITGNERVRHIYQTIDDVSLAGQESKRPPELSGGMKRKLSLALAFVGESQVMILDEPSSGLDPHSRRSVWNAIRRYRSDRTVLLSTQHMEEADYLGDRVAIMSAGRIVCCGSSIYLNKTFGTGYKLRVECRLSRREQIFKHIRQHYFDAVNPPEARNISPGRNTNTDPFIDYVLELKTHELRAKDTELELIRLLEDLEDNAESLSIRSYGLKSSSIEDVMLNTGKYFASNGRNEQSKAAKAYQLAAIGGTKSESSVVSLFYLLKTLVIMHLNVYRNHSLVLYAEKIVVPLYGIHTLHSNLSRSQMDEIWQRPETSTIVAHLIYFPIRDLTKKFKIIQLTSNVTVMIYWLAQALTDLIWLILPMISLIRSVSNWEYQSLIGSWQLVCLTSLALLTFYLASMLFSYFLSFFVSKRFSVISFYIIAYSSTIYSSITLIIFTNILESNPDWALAIIAYTGILLLPTDAFRWIFIGLRTKCYVMFEYEGTCTQIPGYSPVLIGFMALAFQIVFYASLLFLIESRYINIQGDN